MIKQPDKNSVQFLPLLAKVLLCSLLLLVLPTSTYAADETDDYLKELEQEAKSSAKTPKKQIPGQKPDPFVTRFEKILLSERPTTYRFYNKLSLEGKKSVISVFRKANKVSVASKKVFDLYFKEKQK